MGNGRSQPSSTSTTGRNSNDNKISAQYQLNQEYWDQLSKNGVLLPPSFGVLGTPSQKGHGPSCNVLSRLLLLSDSDKKNTSGVPVSYMSYLIETDLSRMILKDYMTPNSLWWTTSAGSLSNNTNVHVGVTKNQGVLFVQQSIPNMALLQLQASSNNNMLSASASWFHRPTNTTLFLHGSSLDDCYVGGHFDHNFSLVADNKRDSSDTKTPMTHNNNDNRYPSKTNDATTTPYHALDTMDRSTANIKLGGWLHCNRNVQGYAAINALGGTAAVQCDLDAASTTPTVTTYASLNLNDADRPPLQVTLQKKSREEHKLSISQVLNFDRLQWNIFEDRAPYVRNTVAWTVEWETKHNKSIVAPQQQQADPQHQPQSSTLQLGAAWQLNRSVAVKAVCDPHTQTLTAALLLKRWSVPRSTLALQSKVSPTANNTANWQWTVTGVTLEVETMPLEPSPDAYYYSHHPRAAYTVPSSTSVPATRAVPRTAV